MDGLTPKTDKRRKKPAAPRTKTEGDKAVEWMEKLSLVGDFYGQRFKLRPWQADIIRTIFGTLDSNGKRKIKKVYISFGRKQAKTFLAAVIVLYCLIYLPKSDQEIVSCAWTHKQARKVFEYACSVINQVKWLRDRCQITYSKGSESITFLPKQNVYRPLPANPQAIHGSGPSVLILDELHVWEGQKAHLLYDALTTGSGAREEVLQVIITTAGYDQSPGNLCYQEYTYAKKWLAGEVKNEHYAAWIFEAPKDCDPFDEKVWPLAMPGLGDFVNLEYVRSKAIEAKDMPSKLNGFKQLYLNMWVDSSFAWIPTDLWKSRATSYTEADLLGRPCYIGFDWGLVRDLTSVSLFFPMDDGTVRTLSYSWIPEESLEARAEDDVRFKDWAKDPSILRVTKGGGTDYDVVKADLLEITKKFQVRLFAGDPTGCGELLQYLKKRGVKTYAVPQSNIGLISAGAKHLESLILNGKLQHNSNPLLDWCVSNTMAKIDHYENLRPVKGKTEGGRIDPVVCLVFATAVATAIEDQRSVTSQMYCDIDT